ncbi:MAG: hypothetical protein H0W86_14230, partial [Armatimonadetes bacterium]|nr:hypothetical protein [Armatimonadota bacterium]
LNSVIIEAVYGQFGSPQNNQERYLVNAFAVKVARGEACHWTRLEGEAVFQWMKANIFDPAAPVTEAKLKPAYIKDNAFDFSAALTAFNGSNQATYLAGQEERRKRTQAGTSFFHWEVLQQPATYVNTLRFASSLADPFAWAAILSGGAPVTLVAAAEASWAMATFEGGFLIVDFIPGGKFVTKGLKALRGKVCFKRASGTDGLPKADKAAEATAEQVVKRSRFWTRPDEAVFWAGRSGGVSVNANRGNGLGKRIAGERQGKTLEMVIEEKQIDTANFTPADWDNVSRELAQNASGVVRVVLGTDPVPSTVRLTWDAVEFPALKQNPKVTKIVALLVKNVETGEFVEKILYPLVTVP